MAKTVNVAGLADVKLGLGVTNQTLVSFGYTQNGVTITTEGHAVNVPGDENGGDDGPPIEIQWLGETARVRLECTKWDTAYENALRGRLYGGTGTAAQGSSPKVPGTLVFAGGSTGLFLRLCIVSTLAGVINEVHNFPCAVLARTPIEKNVGTKYSRLIVEFECYKHPTTGVLENDVSA